MPTSVMSLAGPVQSGNSKVTKYMKIPLGGGGTHLATWALQERLLPARTLYIGNSGIFWECRSGTRSEFLPDGLFGMGGSHPVFSEGKR